MAKKSEIPFGAQFSPNQVDLVHLIQLIVEYEGNRTQLTEAIRDSFFTTQAANQRLKLAENTVLALRAYDLLDEQGNTPTPLTEQLYGLIATPLALYERFARHILLKLRGITVLETIITMQNAGDEISLDTLQIRLEQRGLHVPRAAVHLSSMRLWLAQAGVFDPTITGGPRLYEVNQSRLKQILGTDLDAIDQLTQLDSSQRAYLRALLQVGGNELLVANRVADLATMLYSVSYNHKELPKSVLFPLRDLGYIEVSKSTAGRGAKPYEIIRTAKFEQELSEPILTAAAEQAGLVPKTLFQQPMGQILSDLKSEDRYTKGKALELLAIYFTRLLDLEFRGWRTRSAETGGAEVDAIVEGKRLIFSRWQMQAKNTAVVRLDDIAKEVGLSLTFIYSNVVMIVTTGDFTRDAYTYANQVMKTTNLNIVLLNGTELDRLSNDPLQIVALMGEKADRAMQVKQRVDYFRTQ